MSEQLIDISMLFTLSKGKQRITPKRANESWITKNYPGLVEKIFEFTKDETDITFAARLQLINAGLHSMPLCIECKIKKVKNINFQYCSNSCAIKSEKTQAKTQKTCVEKYGKRFNKINKKLNFGQHYLQKNIKNLEDINNKEFMNNLINQGWKSVANHFGLTLNSHSSTFNFLRKFGYEPELNSGYSNQERDLSSFLKKYINNLELNTKKIITPLELDLYSKEYNIAIEYNGLFYHSFLKKESKNEINYHKNKTEFCESKNIQLIHIFENEWINSQEKVKSLILSKFGLYEKYINARQTVVKELTNTDYRDFCNRNHMQGYCQASIKLGLYDNQNNLVSIMSFSKSRYKNKEDYEVIRFCSLLNTNVRGGFSKLLKYFERKFNPKSLMSYGNRRWCYIHNNVYLNNGFILSSFTQPNYYYTKKNNVYNRGIFQKHKLKTQLDIFDETKTETENMFMNGYRRFWDSGNLKYIKEY